ncbi:MAG: DOD-type homing endonuclease protein [Candidatus Levybacteria bacterium]|nr:DOD-type homing endonuclease protein [Candidatus Levybacteria bacterium]
MIIGFCPYCKRKFRKREQKRKFCSLICSSNFNKNGLKQIKLPPKSKFLAEFVGICLGDGCVAKYQIGITLNTIADKNYIPYVVNLINNLFPAIKVALVRKRDANALDVRINSRIISDFLLDMGIVPNNKKVPDWILTSGEYRNYCVRGLFDTEGSISFKTYVSKKGISLYKQLNFRNTNEKLMRFVRDALKDMGLRPTMTLKKSLYLSTHESIEYFNKRVGFGNPKLTRRATIRTVDEYNIWKNNVNFSGSSKKNTGRIGFYSKNSK